MTEAQSAALTWLREHTGDGVFDRTGVVLAAGERAPFARSTWNALRDLGLVELYGGNTGRRRLRLAPTSFERS